MVTTRPALCFVGPMLGRNLGWVTTQGEILAELFEREGYQVRVTSAIPNPAFRLADMVRSLVVWRSAIDVMILSVFSGRAFILVEAVSALACRLRLPQIHVLRGGALPEFTTRHPRWVRRVLQRADWVVSPSGYLAHYARQLGLDVAVIPNVLDLERYPYRHRDWVAPRLLWMRTFHPIYHPEMAVEVLAALLPGHPQATLTMAGQEKGSLAAVRQLAAERGVEGRVRFVGFLDLAGKQREFASHDIFLNTNRVDNMPVSVVEAAAFGLPVVATSVGGIPYLLEHEQTGLLVGDGDVEGMVAAVGRLLDDPGLAARLSANGRRLAEGCAWTQVRAQWEALFQRVLQADRGG